MGVELMSDYAREIKAIFGNVQDDRADLEVGDRIDDYGKEVPNENKIALIKLKKFIVEQCSDIDTAYKKIFGEFDVNNDGTLSREEFLKGLDAHNKTLRLTERQKIRLM